MTTMYQLQCLVCGQTYEAEDVRYVCPKHGREGILDVIYDYEQLSYEINWEALSASHDQTMWRYRALLPLQREEDTAVLPLPVGGTPLIPAPRLAQQHQLGGLWVKDDGRNPTASLKDRASALALLKAHELNPEKPLLTTITTASTGNAAAALSGLCASIGQPNVIFVPHTAPPAKIAQLAAYGSTVMLVEGTYDQATDLCHEAAEKFGWYNRSTGFNPYMSEGKKTVSYEITEQLGWNAPDVVLVSVGDGCIIGGVYKGFYDLLQLGWLDTMPQLLGIQAEGSNYLTEAWQNGEDVLTKSPIQPHTVADSISAGLPRDRLKALRAVQKSGGAFLTVSDDEILAAIPALARATGIFAEPASAASYAGLLRALAQGLIKPGESVVIINTGHGLKDVASAQKGVALAGAQVYKVEPTLEAISRKL
jgi:threonine synthase